MRIAIIIGVNYYKQKSIEKSLEFEAFKGSYVSFQSLPSPIYDAEIIFTLLCSSANYREEDILLLRGTNKAHRKTTPSNVRSEILRFLSKYEKKEITEILFYFSGHGVRIQSGNEANFNYVLSTGFMSDRNLNEMLKSIDARRIVKIIDSCFAGLPNVEQVGQIILSACSKSQKIIIHTLFSDFTFTLIKILFNEKNRNKELSYNLLNAEICEYLEEKRAYGVTKPTAQYSTAVEGNFLVCTDTTINLVRDKILDIYRLFDNSIKIIGRSVKNRKSNDADFTRFLSECNDHFVHFFFPILYLPPGSEPIKDLEVKSRRKKFRGIWNALIKRIVYLVNLTVLYYDEGKFSINNPHLPNPNIVFENLLFCAYFFYFRENWLKAERLYSIIIDNIPNEPIIFFTKEEIHHHYGSVLLKLAKETNNFSQIHKAIDQFNKVVSITVDEGVRAKTWYNLSQASRYNREYEEAHSSINESERLYRQIRKKKEVKLFESVLNESIIVRLLCAREAEKIHEKKAHIDETTNYFKEIHNFKPEYADGWYYYAFFFR